MIEVSDPIRRRQPFMQAMTEKDWQQAVQNLAIHYGWRHYHTHDSRRSNPGFPDLVLVRGTRLVFAELKTDAGRVSEVQWSWLNALYEAEREVYVWRPRDLRTVKQVLGRDEKWLRTS